MSFSAPCWDAYGTKSAILFHIANPLILLPRLSLTNADFLYNIAQSNSGQIGRTLMKIYLAVFDAGRYDGGYALAEKAFTLREQAENFVSKLNAELISDFGTFCDKEWIIQEIEVE
jgi:hypothetical protein